MRKYFIILTLFVSVFVFSGCKSFHNEIYNKSYNVEIDIRDFENAVQAAIEKADPAVVGVHNYSLGNTKLGSAVVYKSIAILTDNSEIPGIDTMNRDDVKIYRYFAVTNRHVVENANTIKVYFGEEDDEVLAKIMEVDPQVDLAVIRFDYQKYIQPLEFADSDQLKKGSFAIALGNPSGYYGSATFGIISYPKRYIPEKNQAGIIDWEAEYIQHDVAINPGNSGGPLINLEGQIIGINTMKFVDEEIDNMGFSIPSNLVLQIIPLLEQGIKPQRPKLGVQIREIRGMDQQLRQTYNIPEHIDYGLYVSIVDENSLAEKANIKVNDIILYFNGVKIRFTYQLRTELNKFTVGSGEEVEVVVYREGKEITLKVTF